MQRNNKHLIVPCSPQGKVQISCLPLSLDKLLALLIDKDVLAEMQADKGIPNVSGTPTSPEDIINSMRVAELIAADQ